MARIRLPERFAAMIERLGHASFVEDRRGVVMVVVGTMVPTLFGVVAFGVDVSMWRAEKLRLQAAVDAAAISAAYVQLNGAGAAATRSVVARELARNGFDPAVDGNAFDVAMQRRNGAAYDDVQVTAETDGAFYFARMLLADPPTLGARALAGIDDGNYGRICVLGLDEEARATVDFNGGPQVELDCTIATNSSDAEAMQISNNSTVSATALIAHGGISGADSPNVTAAQIATHVPRVTDPLGVHGRNLQVPPRGLCAVNGKTQLKKDTTLSPGRYCGDLRVNGGTITFEPGVYIIDGGDFKTTGQSTLVGDGVTFVMTGSSSSDIGNVDFAGGTTLNLRAPDSDDAGARALGYEGVLFFQDPAAPISPGNGQPDNKLLGGSVARLEGWIYFPRQTLLYTGGADLDESCLAIVARKVMFRGNASFVQTPGVCEELGVEPIRTPSVRLMG